MQFNLSTVTIGADPEIFVARRGQIVSAHNLPIGTKKQPKETQHGHVQVDGLACEVNVRPSLSKISFIKNCSSVLQDLDYLVKQSDPEMYLVCQATASFEEKYLESLPSEALELGCDPDWDAYNLQPNPRPDAKQNFRTAGGHIHIGWCEDAQVESIDHIAKCAEVAKQLDYTIGLYSLEFDNDSKRRELYGRAGCFRPKTYGMEYRVLSPMWLTSTAHTSMVWSGVMKGLRMLNEEIVLDEQFDGLARDYINGSEYNWRFLTPELEKAIA